MYREETNENPSAFIIAANEEREMMVAPFLPCIYILFFLMGVGGLVQSGEIESLVSNRLGIPTWCSPWQKIRGGKAPSGGKIKVSNSFDVSDSRSEENRDGAPACCDLYISVEPLATIAIFRADCTLACPCA